MNSPNSNIIIIKKDNPGLLKLNYLVIGDYELPLKIQLPSDTTPILRVELQDNYNRIAYSDFTIHNSFEIITFKFSIKNSVAGRAFKIVFSTATTTEIIIKHPVSPKIISNKIFTLDNLNKLEYQITKDLNNYSFSSSVPQKESQAILQSSESNRQEILRKEQLESFINTNYFRGFLNSIDAEKQLEYVVYHKLFTKGEHNFFNKLKRKIYRSVLIFLYTKLTKNTTRKAYFVKLYKNYINNNLLAENYHSN